MSLAIMEENLESGWVSVRPKVFEEKENHKFVFIVAWNDIVGKFAVTCHNRTVQRRSTVLDLDCNPPNQTQTHGTCQSPRAGQSFVPQDTRSSGTGEKCPVLRSWDLVTPNGEVLEAFEDLAGREDFSWAGLFSLQDLRAVHQQLCAINSDLEPCLPSLPEQPSGVWTVLFGGPGPSPQDSDAVCVQLQVYLGHALDTCGWRILSHVLFCDSDDADEYYESLGELRQKGYEDALEVANRRMHEVLDRHKAMDSMVGVLQVYPEEDEVYGDLLEATTQLYHYLLQPFRDIRELATLHRQQIKMCLQTERLGPRRVDSLRKEDEEWQRKAQAAVLSIQDLTVRFFESTTRAQKVLKTNTVRLCDVRFEASESGGFGFQMRSLQGGQEAMARVDQLEALYYGLQLQLYDVRAEVLRCEELLLTAQLHSLRRQIIDHKQKVQEQQGGSADCSSLQTLRQQERDEDERNVSLSQERRTTLDRLRSLKQDTYFLLSKRRRQRHKVFAHLHGIRALKGVVVHDLLLPLCWIITDAVSSPMDEVLESLKRGSFHLRKAELRVLGPDPEDDSTNILAQIRQGIHLKKVRTRPEQQRHPKSFPHSADALTRSIHEALRRIKEASPESESEDEGLPCTDWES
ncbi:junction-mediating and -regulatory protein [Nematolebias whitei]|uniref:junction-mediating and -regulatory protein n=1 Tax=Nematolebias whitei TaxID=451745 RepID=UPI00189A8B54|nr:junction-mediating and -regulatory protein [Nematolebias whitei]